MEERLKSHYESLARVIRFTRTADAKAAPVLAVQLAFLGTLAARSDKLSTIITRDCLNLESVAIVALIVLYGAFFTAVVVLTALVYIPRNSKTDRSLIFFEDIAAMEYQAFEKASQDLSEESIEGQLLDQIHRVSKIASLKMLRVRQAFLTSVPATILWLILLAWGSIQS